MKMRAYKTEIDPTEAQIEKIKQTQGVCDALPSVTLVPLGAGLSTTSSSPLTEIGTGRA